MIHNLAASERVSLQLADYSYIVNSALWKMEGITG